MPTHGHAMYEQQCDKNQHFLIEQSPLQNDCYIRDYYTPSQSRFLSLTQSINPEKN